VAGVIHFGGHWPTIPDGVLAELRAAMGDEEVRVINNECNPGDLVEITTGAFHGLQAIVTLIVPAKQRVAVLLDILGRQATVELGGEQLVPKSPEERLEVSRFTKDHRKTLVAAAARKTATCTLFPGD
jgi:transcriptional antiterminator RfaH